MNKVEMNQSGWSPAGRAVLVRPLDAKEKKPGSVIVVPKSISDRTKLMEDRAIVIEVGPLAWNEEPVARATVGDEVILAAFSGYLLLGDDGVDYRFVNERDVFAVRNKGEQNG